MTCRHFVALFALLTTVVVSGQAKEFDFSGFQTSDSNMKWQSVKRVNPRKAQFSQDRITFSLDKIYKLVIVSHQDLPDGGIVYRCKDETKKDVTVTLIGNDRMFLYYGVNRYQITFNHPIIASTQHSYAESD
ncbi:hypothetical protein [Flavobacterium sp.]|uniref:hypothetical protein n=1 Tax=Flavobacterium sp. TaxID=239 RepID=UPI00120297FD|nr:hypothetical protein [Flavobacterium sp.]RZJ71184.1 MAG: hypothetical protein EOO49_10555 [Flavobacterium sp.]